MLREFSLGFNEAAAIQLRRLPSTDRLGAICQASMRPQPFSCGDTERLELVTQLDAMLQ